MEKKTILEWLEEAKQQGYDWADAAIRNYDPNFLLKYPSDVDSLSDTLIFAFSWDKSPEGRDYWEPIVDKLREDPED